MSASKARAAGLGSALAGAVLGSVSRGRSGSAAGAVAPLAAGAARSGGAGSGAGAWGRPATAGGGAGAAVDRAVSRAGESHAGTIRNIKVPRPSAATSATATHRPETTSRVRTPIGVDGGSAASLRGSAFAGRALDMGCRAVGAYRRAVPSSGEGAGEDAAAGATPVSAARSSRSVFRHSANCTSTEPESLIVRPSTSSTTGATSALNDWPSSFSAASCTRASAASWPLERMIS